MLNKLAKLLEDNANIRHIAFHFHKVLSEAENKGEWEYRREAEALFLLLQELEKVEILTLNKGEDNV
jgi:hypothetical protein